ncbi:hypothetical protein MMC34_005586 [Xylographa carneopallida]|nr:hypothetical protein [Xylographa carneopallida]
MAQTNPFLLAADNNPKLLPLLRSKPELASSQDEHGYSCMHAAASYNHIDLLRILVTEFNTDVNTRDEDGETALFVVETVEAAHVLLEELKADATIINADGVTAEEKIRAEGDYPTIADYLLEARIRAVSSSGNRPITNSGAQHLLSLPPNITIDFGTLDSAAAGEGDDQAPDPEFRRRIEELATRDDFEAEQGQRDLRNLIKDAVRGVGSDGEKEVRRRMS